MNTKHSPLNYLVLLFLLLPLQAFSQRGLTQLPPHLQALLRNQATEKGLLTFPVLPAKSTIGAKMLALPPGVPPPFSDAFTGGAVFAYEVNYDVNICPGDDGSPDFTFWVLHLYPDQRGSRFTTHQKNKSASLHLTGTMDRYKPAGDFCTTRNIVKVDSSPGGLSVTFKTHTHLTPRNFMVWEGQMSGGKAMADLLKVRDLFFQNLQGYYQYIKEYRGKPHITGFTGQNYDLTPGDRVPVPAGAEDTTWKAISDGLVSLKNAAEAYSIASDVKDFASTGASLFGKPRQRNDDFEADALGFISSAVNLSGLEFPEGLLNPSAMAEAHIYNTVNTMVSAYAEINKQYAANGDATAQEVQRRARVPINDPKVYQEAVDADYMIHQLSDLLSNLDEMEQAVAEMNLPKNVATGTIWGPGLWQQVRSYGQPGSPVSPVGQSVAHSESRATASPEMFDALRAAGINIPNIDVEAMLQQVQAMVPEGVGIDISEPLFTGQLAGTRMQRFRDVEWPQLMLNFSISSPDETIDFDWLHAATIFDVSPQEEYGQPVQKTFFLAPDGDDGNAGTETEPFATLQHALDTLHMERMRKADVTLIIKDGIYEQTAEVDWSGSSGLSPLTIQADNKHGAVFIGTAPVSEEIQWIVEGNNWKAPKPLHPQQVPYVQGSNPFTTPAPFLVINGTRMTHLPFPQALPAPGMCSFLGDMVYVFPPTDVTDLNEADVQVFVRPHFLGIKGGGQITVRNLLIRSFAFPAPNNTPGISHQGNVSVLGCKFE
ncbi:MAG: hypothetical protein KJT03_08580 [Verrucomicrobiae bacterium]|nr:hypothetical protein [Verrucomicrobiae bacterium]